MSLHFGQLVWHRSPACSTSACVEVAFDGEHVHLRDSKNPDREPLTFTVEEWQAFTAGVVDGAFTPR